MILPIIFTGIFSIIVILYFVFWITFSSRKCESNEYFNSSRIFTYGIILGLAYIISIGFKEEFYYVKRKNNESFIENSKQEIFSFLLGQWIIINIYEGFIKP